MTDEEKPAISVADAANRAALLIDSSRYILQDVQEDYFEKYDSVNKKDADLLCWEFSRNRAKVLAISQLLYEAEKVLAQADIVR